MGKNNQLRDIILQTVPQQYHDEVYESMKNLGPEKTFFTKVFYLWTEEQKRLAMQEIFRGNHLGGKYKTILFDCLKVHETLKKCDSHKHYIEKSFSRFKSSFECLTEDQIKNHDNSKVSSLLEIVGYTARWEWGLDCRVWREALAHHYQVSSLSLLSYIDPHFQHNPHHPQHCPGQPMEQRYLEESVVDMIGRFSNILC